VRPATRVKIALRAALRRRYAYSGLRLLRRGLRRALEHHRALAVGPAPYDGTSDEIERVYVGALRRLARRWPCLPFADPRAEP